MIRSLAMIAVAGFVVSVLSIAGAAALGGYDANKHGWTFPVQWDWDDNNDSHDGRSARIDWNSPQTTKEVVWGGDNELEIAIPADVTFTQGAQPKITITGPSDAVDHVIVDGGHIGFSGRGSAKVSVKDFKVDVKGLEGYRRLKIDVVAPDVHSITATAASRLTITELKREDLELNVHAASRVEGKIDVNRLDLNVHSAGEATLSGRADDLELEVHSAGKARLAQLAVKTAHGEANSAGDADIAPTESLDIEVQSGADVTVYGHPSKVNTNVHSGGDIRYADASAAPASSASTNSAEPKPPTPPSAPKAPPPPPTPRTKPS